MQKYAVKVKKNDIEVEIRCRIFENLHFEKLTSIVPCVRTRMEHKRQQVGLY